MNSTTEYFDEQQKQLYQYMVGATQNVLSLEKIFNDVIAAEQSHARALEGIGKNLHEKIGSGNESDLVICCYQQLSNTLLKDAQIRDRTALQIQTEIAEPFTQFVANFRQTNRSLNHDSKQQLKEIIESRKAMLRCEEQYWKLMRSSEIESLQVQQMVDCIERGERTKEDFQKQFNHSFRVQQSAEEAERDYKRLIEITNQKWKAFLTTWEQIFENVGLNDQSRSQFSKHSINALLKCLKDEDQVYLSRLQELDVRIPVRSIIEKKIQLSLGNQIIQTQEVFVHYEQWKKNNEHKAMVTDTWQIVGDEIIESERTAIDSFLNSLFKVDNSNKDEILIRLKTLLQKASARLYFLDTLSKLHSTSQLYYITLGEQQFTEICNLFKHWINYLDLNDLYECEEIYKLLSLCIRIVNIGQQRLNIAQSLSELQFWTKVERWSQLFFYINDRKIQDKRRRAALLVQAVDGNNVIKKGFSFLNRNLKRLTGQVSQVEINEGEIVYQIMEDLNLFVISLQLPAELSADIILYVAFQQANIDKEHVVKLLEKQEDRNNNQLRKQIYNGKSILQSRIEKYEQLRLFDYERKVVYATRLILPYLSNDHPEKLLTVSHHFSTLKEKIIKLHFTQKLQDQVRLNLIGKLLKLSNDDSAYVQKKIQVGLELDIKCSSIEETITLDVQRSLHIHKARISSAILQSLLRTYAYFHKDVNYCQGMNYIAGYLFLTFNQEGITYEAFEIIMEKYFKPIFLEDFQKLKCGFYQFDRLLSLFMPELSQHLKDEKIDASYYASSWFITLFSNVFQYSMRSALLNVIWDIFLIEGWKGFFKCAFFILRVTQERILKLEFDQILHFMGQLIRSDLFQIETEDQLVEHIKQFIPVSVPLKGEIMSLKISNKLLKNLENEHNCFQLKFANMMKQYKH